jgi:excinuclease ABC subunit A
MQFLSDVYIRCSECNGRRYRPHILEVKLRASLPSASEPRRAKFSLRKLRRPENQPLVRDWSIADLLDATVDEAIQVLLSFFHIGSGRRALQSLKLLQELGLGYLRLGQPINTLSGGESQRLKLASHLAEFVRDEEMARRRTLFLFDEPTTGLHFDDIRILLHAFQRLVDEGHSLLVIEHNLDLIRAADWVIDLGPEGGEEGGKVVAEGAPDTIAASQTSHTGRALREHLQATHSLEAVA